MYLNFHPIHNNFRDPVNSRYLGLRRVLQRVLCERSDRFYTLSTMVAEEESCKVKENEKERTTVEEKGNVEEIIKLNKEERRKKKEEQIRENETE